MTQVSARLLTVLQHVHTYTWTLQSDDSRNFSYEVAMAASKGFISTEVVPGSNEYGRRWKVTEYGLRFLREHAHLISEAEVAAYKVKPIEDILGAPSPHLAQLAARVLPLEAGTVPAGVR